MPVSRSQFCESNRRLAFPRWMKGRSRLQHYTRVVPDNGAIAHGLLLMPWPHCRAKQAIHFCF